MRILHCCLSNPYIDGYGYQENFLPRINFQDGNEVLIVASTETYRDGKLFYLSPSEYETEYGVKIIRLPYAKWLPGILGRKFRVIVGFENVLYTFKPDAILFHGPCSYEIKTVARYRASHSGTRLYVDTHEAYYNSARNWISKNILHGTFYRKWFQKALPNIDKVLYIGLAEKQYMRDILYTPEEKLEYYPLGGEIMPLEEKAAIRKEIRDSNQIDDDTVVFVHTGKMNRLKKTVELMKAFSAGSNHNSLLLIIGTVASEMLDDFNDCLAANARIRFLGWMSAAEMKKYICASDMYLQPGDPSATMQIALCCGVPVLIRDTDYYQVFTDADCGVSIRTDQEMNDFFQKPIDKDWLKAKSDHAFKIAYELLDYKKLAARIYV